MTTKQEKGFSQIMLLVLLLMGIVVVSGVSYYVLKAKGEAPVMQTATNTFQSSFSPIPSSTDTKSIETDIDATTLDSMDTDLNSLKISANSL